MAGPNDGKCANRGREIEQHASLHAPIKRNASTMTLFKKIFDTHNTAIDPTASQSRDDEPGYVEDAVDSPHSETVADRLNTLASSGHSGANTNDFSTVPSDEPASVATFPGHEGETDPTPGETMEADTETMAERAALAQRQILETQASMGQPRSAPDANEGRVDPPPAQNSSSNVLPVAETRTGRRTGRVKTRLLGFDPNQDLASTDPVRSAQPQMANPEQRFPVGWIAIVDGPGRGHAFALHSGATMVGRGEDQGIRLDFGDSSISRQNHAAIAYDNEQNSFFLGHGGKSNIIRLNDRPVLSTEEMSQGDLIRIGETTLRLVVLCGPDFNWGASNDQEI